MTLDRHAPVSTVMSADLLTATPDTSLEEVRDVLKERGFHHLPVVDEDGRLLGLISHTDVGRAKPGDVTVAHLMRDGAPVTVRADDHLELAIAMLAGGSIHALPVIDDDGFLAGIVTTSDLLRRLIAEPDRD